MKWLLTVCGLALICTLIRAAEPPFTPPNWPKNIAPVDWPGNPGSRYEMPEFPKHVAKENQAIRVKVTPWTEALYKADDMGVYQVGDQIRFDVIIGDSNSEYFGSVKDRRDGGKFDATVFWIDESGKQSPIADSKAAKMSCATCGGYFGMYLDIPSFAKTGRHRIKFSYVHQKLGIDLAKEMTFNVVNDGAWDDQRLIERVRATHQAVLILQNGRACRELALANYAGTADTYLLAPCSVPDRCMDHCNFGGLEEMKIGQYGPDNRGLVRFDLSAVPRKARIDEAYLQLYLKHGGRKSPTVAAYEVLKDWSAGRGESGPLLGMNPAKKGEASWQCSAFPTKWSKGGCDEAGQDRSAEAVGNSTVSTETKKVWVTVPLPSELVNRWVADETSNHGLLLTDAKNEVSFICSSECSDAAMRPRLILAVTSGIAAASTQPCRDLGLCTDPAIDKKETAKKVIPDKFEIEKK